LSALLPESLHTLRLTGERLRSDHAAELTALLLDPAVTRWLWPFPTPRTATDVVAGLADGAEHWEHHGFGLWLLRDRVSGEMVGRGGLQYTDVDGASETEVAWAIVPERWGQGLATELAHACVKVAFGALELDGLVAMTMPDNLASRRVMEKAAFVFDREIEHAGLPHVLYRRRRES
jgi:[ribosomal protein S5]-alanine N-acetyltransferase